MMTGLAIEEIYLISSDNPLAFFNNFLSLSFYKIWSGALYYKIRL